MPTLTPSATDSSRESSDPSDLDVDSPDGEDIGPSPRRTTSTTSTTSDQESQPQPAPSPRLATDAATLPPVPRPQSGGGPAARFSPAQLRREAVRLSTFQGWPLSYISPAELARAGFIYTGSRDCVRCVFCG